MLGVFRSCFGVQQSHSQVNVPSRNCIFCGITKERGFKVVYDDAEYTVFQDRSPGARLHLLCVPKHHIDNVKTLTKNDVPLLQRMSDIGNNLLEEAGFADVQRRLGFHIPPFFSVNHLHLHVLGLPFVTWYDKLKYKPRQSSTRSKGFSHFVEIHQAIDILEGGGKIGVKPC